MKKILLFLVLILAINAVWAEPFKITPVEKITTCTKDFKIGNVYEFKKVGTEEKIYGTVVFYRPNGITGQEAQIEISSFRDGKNNLIPGRITIIPANHKTYQEFVNYCSIGLFDFVRGSEIILEPDIHTFEINNEKSVKEEVFISIKPAQEISTDKDEIEIGDYIAFETTKDAYNITAGTKIFGIVDYVDENGWSCDNAVIYFKKFVTRDKNGKKLVINSDLEINGFELLKYKSGRTKQFFNYLGIVFRGKEVDIKACDTDVNFNLLVK